jgi:predicted nucleic acid-binding protein
LWKESSVLKKIGSREAENLVDVFAQLLRYLNTIDVSGVEGRVFRTAMETGLTVYDASYLVLAQRGGLTLVTEDAKLRKNGGRNGKSSELHKVDSNTKTGLDREYAVRVGACM